MSDINITVNDEIVNIDVLDTPVLVEVSNAPGPAGAGVAVGGTTGQVLAKASDANYDTEWVDVSGGVWGTITGTLSNQTDLQNALNAKVPYSGATGDVSLGEYGINVGNVIYDTTPTGIPTDQGATYWDADAETVALIMNGTIQKIGEDTFYHVRNTTGSTIAKGTAVRFSGTTGNSGRLLIAPMLADGTYPSQYYMGITSEELVNNADGKVYHFGKMRNINTSAFADGDVLYVSPSVAGALTATAPVAPNNIIVAAAVVHAANNGTLMIRTTLGSNINSDEGVLLTTPTANQGLFYDSGLWVNKSITTALGYTPVPTTRNITINGVTYDLSADRTYTISTGISGSGAAGQVTYWTGASAVSGDTGLTWDAVNKRLGINTSGQSRTINTFHPTGAPGFNLWAGGGGQSATFASGSQGSYNTSYGVEALLSLTTGAANTAIGYNALRANTTGGVIVAIGADALLSNTTGGGNIAIGYRAGHGTGTNANTTGANNIFIGDRVVGVSATANNRTFIGNTDTTSTWLGGNLLLGTTSDGGQRLQVIGDTLLRGSGNTSATTALTVQNSDSTNLLRVRNDGALLFSNGSDLQIYSQQNSARSSNIGSGFAFQSSLGSGFAGPDFRFFNGFTSSVITSGARAGILVNNIGFQPTSGTATYTILQLESLINQTGGANGITRGLYVNPTLTAAADFRAIETTAGNVLFGSGFFWDNANGRLGIGTNVPATSLDINTTTTQPVRVRTTSNIEVAHYFGSGVSGLDNYAGFRIIANTNGVPYIGLNTSSNVAGYATGNQRAFFAYWGDDLGFASVGYGGNTHAIGWSTSNGNVKIGGIGAGRSSFSDLGVRFGVIGDTLLRGSGNTSATTALTVQNSDSSILFSARNDGAILYGQNIQRSLIYITDALGTLGSQSLTGQSNITISNTRTTTVPLINGSLFITRDGLETSTILSTTHLLIVGHRPTEGFAPTSGITLFTAQRISPTINQTGGANGITRGLYVNPTLTSAADFRAIEVSAGVTVLAPSVTARASLRIPSGTAPTSPVNGDIWFDGTDIKMRIGGVTKTFTLL